jgi:hypothetical protein
MTPAEAVILDATPETVAGMYQHLTAAISASRCPVHRTPMDAVAAPPRRIAGHCIACRHFWGWNQDTGEAGNWLDHDLVRPEQVCAAVPDWMAWRQP